MIFKFEADDLVINWETELTFCGGFSIKKG